MEIFFVCFVFNIQQTNLAKRRMGERQEGWERLAEILSFLPCPSEMLQIK